MQEICIPVPNLKSREFAEVDVRMAGQTRKINFRIEAFDWDTVDELNAGRSHRSTPQRIIHLRRMIEEYDREWELIQIFNPKPKDRSILVMFRQKQ